MTRECAFFGGLGKDGQQETCAAGKRYLCLSIRVGDGDAAEWVSALVFDSAAIDVVDKFVQGARVYVEGKMSMTEWTSSDGVKRHELNVISWRCRLPHIGCNKPKKKQSEDPAPKDGAHTRATSTTPPRCPARIDRI